MSMRKLTCHPCVLMASMRGLYLSLLVSMMGVVYLMYVYVNSIIWMVRWGVGICGPSCLHGAPWMYMMFGLSLDRNVHLIVRHEHGSIHGGMVLSSGWLSILPTFVRSVWCHVWMPLLKLALDVVVLKEFILVD